MLLVLFKEFWQSATVLLRFGPYNSPLLPLLSLSKQEQVGVVTTTDTPLNISKFCNKFKYIANIAALPLYTLELFMKMKIFCCSIFFVYYLKHLAFII